MTSKTVLITGGGSGIGLEIAKTLVAKGNKVIITGRNPDTLKKAAEGLENISTIACDINNPDEITRLVAHLNEDHTNLDVLINNAGAGIGLQVFN